MATDNQGTIELVNETSLNIATLLTEHTGSTRRIDLTLAAFPLDDDLSAREVHAHLKLTRLQSGIMATGTLAGHVELECVRCLNLFDQPFKTRLTEQFRQTVDVHSGVNYTPPRGEPDNDAEDEDDEPGFEINDAHEINLTELLRQNILLALPMRPDCGDICPGPPPVDNGPESDVDARFAALQHLLDDE